jgi:voltage-gated potassium channel
MQSLQSRFRVFSIIFIGVFAVGIIGFMAVEGLSFIDALYFSIVTMATVGYGDIYPKTSLGKFLVIFIIISGGISGGLMPCW